MTANIAESQAARAASGFKEFSARAAAVERASAGAVRVRIAGTVSSRVAVRVAPAAAGAARASIISGGRVATGPIRPGEVTTFQNFVDRSVIGDGIEGHELWQHASLKANGLATTRLSTEASKDNPVIALDRAVHQQVNVAQRALAASAHMPIENINANAQILRNLNIAPESDILRLQQMAIKHAKTYGY